MTRLTLTFDNGPEPAVTSRVLELLRERSLRAHFFVLGKHLESAEGRACVERAVRDGHRVGNHSYSHEVPLGEDPRPDAVEAELVRTDRLLRPLLPAGEERRFRPFGGGGVIGTHLLRADVVEHLVAAEYSCVLWSSVPGDWRDPVGWVDRALADCERSAHGVVVLHDIAGACLDGLPRFLDALERRGVEVVLELPDDCVPIVRGVPRMDLAALTAPRGGVQ